MSLDFTGLTASLLAHSRAILEEWLPTGKWEGHEYCVGNLSGAPGSSLKINSHTGVWKDFADDGTGGADLTSLYAAIHSISQGDAAKRLSNGSAPASIAKPVKPASKAKLPAIVPLPDGLTAPREVSIRSADAKTWDQYAPSNTWWYRDGIVCRVDRQDGSKEIVPHVWTAKGWRQGAMPEPRPLYRLEFITEPSDVHRPILIVEGEKAVHAALLLVNPTYTVTTWAGGAAAWRKTDWTPLAGRKVLLWPDADEPGIKAMQGIAGVLQATEIKIIDPRDVVDGWDAADAVAEGWTWESFKQWAKPRISIFNKGEDHGSEAGAGSTGKGHGAGEGDGRRARDSGGLRQVLPVQPAAGGNATDSGGGVGAARGVAASGRASTAGSQHRPPARNSPVGSQPAVAVGSEAQELRADDAQAGGDEDGGRTDTPRTDPSQRPVDQRLRDRGAEDGQGGVGLEAVPDLAGLTHIEIWQALKLDFTQSGPIPNLDNVLRCLSGDSYFHGKIWFDEFLQRILTDSPPREWADTDDTIIQARLQRAIGIKKVSRETVTHAVILAAHQNRRNVVKEYLRSVEWDRIDRCSGFFSRVFGAPDAEYTRAASRNFWVSMVARAERPGCKVDNMIILEGGQGMGKSTVANIIGGDWFAEQHESATEPVKFALILAGKLLVEISEMDAFSRSEVNRVKQVVSCRSDRYRVPYARHAQDHDRQGIFIGTTNKDDWNRDETGARRFWPIRCEGRADLQYAAKYRDQLFAEALYLFQQGIDWWEMPEEETKRQQKERYTEDTWQARIEDWLASSARLSVTVQEILDGPLKLDAGRQGSNDTKRVTACLRFIDWENGKQERLKKGMLGPSDAKFVRRWFAPGQNKFTVSLEKFKTDREINDDLNAAGQESETFDTSDT